MEHYDFDAVIDRRHTNCLKYDFAAERGKPADILPLWVADMDFRTAEPILEELHRCVSHGIFGYSEGGESYFEAVSGWMRAKHGWDVERSWLVKTPGVVFGIAMAIRAFTREGDAVLIQQPVYYPFSEAITDNGRKLISSDLVRGGDGRYRIDFADLEAKIAENQVKLFILCNPHNPVGRVWTEAELLRIGDICLKNGVTVVSDEIHEDFVYGEHRHIVFANLKPELAAVTVTCTSPSKTFNLAGLQVSNLFIPNPDLRKPLEAQIAAAGYSQVNALGLAACEAAYRGGDDWYRRMLSYVEGNIDYMADFLAREIPRLSMVKPEGTYLVWVDFRRLGLSGEELEDLIVQKAHLWLDSGAIFGAAGEGFERFNVACPRATLERALQQLKQAVEQL